MRFFFFFQAEDGIRDADVTGVQTCALPISGPRRAARARDDGPSGGGGRAFRGRAPRGARDPLLTRGGGARGAPARTARVARGARGSARDPGRRARGTARADVRAWRRPRPREPPQREAVV